MRHHRSCQVKSGSLKSNTFNPTESPRATDAAAVGKLRDRATTAMSSAMEDSETGITAQNVERSENAPLNPSEHILVYTCVRLRTSWQPPACL